MPISKKIKIIIFVILLSIFASLIFTSVNLNNKLNKSKASVERLCHNINVKDTKIADLSFTTDELKTYIKSKDTYHKREVDSILKAHNVSIKDLIQLQSIKIAYRDTSKSSFTRNGSITKTDSTYIIPIKAYRNCLKVYGNITSKDSTTTVYITEVEGSNNIYITKSYNKTFWDKIFFRKGKEVTKMSSDCGDTLSNQTITISK